MPKTGKRAAKSVRNGRFVRKSARTGAFLTGVGRLVDVGGRTTRQRVRKNLATRSDAENLARDWARVGGYLQQSADRAAYGCDPVKPVDR